MTLSLRLDLLHNEADICRVAAMEAASYPADEAASEDGVRFRQQHAGAFFRAAYLQSNDSEELVGFVNGTLTAQTELTDESMSKHDPAGSLLCIHSVVVDPAHRRRGIARQMLKQYVCDVSETQPQVTRMMLISKAYLVEFYVSCGFAVMRLSPVVHGKDPWFELALDCQTLRLPPIVQVDAFTSEPYQGNPAAVVLLSASAFHKPGVSTWMQRVAMENNLSETAYAAPRAGINSKEVMEYDLRWFTPGTEVELCGHATLATTFALHDAGHVTPDQKLHFHTLSGVLVCRFELVAQTQELLVLMDFPEQPVASPPDFDLNEMAEALGVSSGAIGDVKRSKTDVLVRVSTEVFGSLAPNFLRLAQFDARGVVVTATADKADVDFQSRFFGPKVGVNEDPVTGSAHCSLGPYWGKILNKATLRGRQFTPVRGGFVSMDLKAAGPGRVLLKGQGALVFRGQLTSAP